MKAKKTEEIIKQMDQISKDLDNFLNADSDYSTLNKKLKSGTISNDEKKILMRGLEELPYWANKIEDSVNKVKDITNDLEDSKNDSI